MHLRNQNLSETFICCLMVLSYADVPGPFIVRAEVTSDNTSIRVSWEWSCRGVPVSINSVKVNYRHEGGSLMVQMVNNTTATSAILPNLKCNTKYTTWVHAEGGQLNRTSVLRMISLPARGMYMSHSVSSSLLWFVTLFQLLPLPLRSLLRS